jgi:hypothetical protein
VTERNLPSRQYGSPSSKAERQIQKLAEAKAAPRAADIVAGVWVSDLEIKADAHAAKSVMRAKVDIYEEFRAYVDGDPVLNAMLGSSLKTGSQKLDARLRDFGDDDFDMSRLFGR